MNRNDFSCRRNSPMSLSGWRILAGRLFQSCGPAAAKLRSPSRVLVRGTQHVSMSADKLAVVYKICCSCIMQRLVDQEGQLNSTRCGTGSQWSCLNTGVMWSRRRVPVTSRAATFCTYCRRLNRLPVMPLNRA